MVLTRIVSRAGAAAAELAPSGTSPAAPRARAPLPSRWYSHASSPTQAPPPPPFPPPKTDTVEVAALLVEEEPGAAFEDVPGVQAGETLTAVRGEAVLLANEFVTLAPGLTHLRTVGLNCDPDVDCGNGLYIRDNANLERLGASSNSLDELELANSLQFYGNPELGPFGPTSFPRLRTVPRGIAIGEDGRTDQNRFDRGNPKVTSIEVR